VAKVIKCGCGYVARGETDDAVIEEIEEHLLQDHPNLADQISADDVAEWIEEA
jgi:predicted small metal-binding protein